MAKRTTKTERQIEFFRRYSLFWLACYQEGIFLVPYSFIRTAEEQNKLFNQGLSSRNGYENRSRHQDRMAIDAFAANDNWEPIWDGTAEEYQRADELARVYGLETGFSWEPKDSNHTQLPKTSV